MPRVRRKPKTRRAVWTRWHREQLLTGFDYFGGGFGLGDQCDFDSMRTAWRELEGELLPAWIADRPGTRPFSWWAFDATERRSRIDDNGPHPFDCPKRKAWLAGHGNTDDPTDHLRGAYSLWFGVPARLCGLGDFDSRIEHESEADYLGRLGLLADLEGDAIPDRILT